MLSTRIFTADVAVGGQRLRDTIKRLAAVWGTRDRPAWPSSDLCSRSDAVFGRAGIAGIKLTTVTAGGAQGAGGQIGENLDQSQKSEGARCHPRPNAPEVGAFWTISRLPLIIKRLCPTTQHDR